MTNEPNSSTPNTPQTPPEGVQMNNAPASESFTAATSGGSDETGPPSTSSMPGTPDTEQVAGRNPVRVATIVWGAILIAIAVGVIAIAMGATVDVELALIVGLGVAGLALVVGSTIASLRRSR